MSSSKARSRNSFEENVAALEAELEAEGFLRFKEIGPLYDRVEQQDHTMRRPTRPTLVTSRARPPANLTAAVTTKPQVQKVQAVHDPVLRAKYVSLIITHRPITIGDLPPKLTPINMASVPTSATHPLGWQSTATTARMAR